MSIDDYDLCIKSSMGYEENQENGNHNIEVKPVLCRKKSMSGGANILVWRGGDTTRRRRWLEACNGLATGLFYYY